MRGTHERIPPHLRRYVAEQDEGAYDAIDHAVWRYILAGIESRLGDAAHPGYSVGLARTGISRDRVPRIADNDRRLSELGWGAVCVDGFLPPRAFQEFQAHAILPIAGDIRTAEHVAYTPAPDIVHEAAGHAPFLMDTTYGRFLRAIGTVGARAFSLPGEAALDEAIRALSRAKEDRRATDLDRARAERTFQRARARTSRASEAARVARLHWWTVEYGLLGTPARYHIYGAGLLSSLGESESCRSAEVGKRPLDATCAEVSYDITRPQPQLFVAESFDHLLTVLDAVASGLAQRAGGATALAAALASEEIATLELDSGLQLTGTLMRIGGTADDPAWLEIAGPGALAVAGVELAGHGRRAHPSWFSFPLGRLVDGSAPSQLDEGALLRNRVPGGAHDSLVLAFRSGVRVTGKLTESVRSPDGRIVALVWEEAEARRGAVPLRVPTRRWVMPLGEKVTSAFAGPADPVFWPPTRFRDRRVPTRRLRTGDERMVLALHEELESIETCARSEATGAALERIGSILDRGSSSDWLLRWRWARQAGAVNDAAEGWNASAPRKPTRDGRVKADPASGASPRLARRRGHVANPMGTDGFEFVEYATTEPAALDVLFRTLGLVPAARHRSKDVTLYRQGDVNFIVDAEPSSFAQAFARVHGPSICAIAFRVRDARVAFERAVALGAQPVRGRAGPMELHLPAIRGIGGSLIYLIDRYGERTIYDVDFVPIENERPVDTAITHVDHLTHNVHKGRMNRWAEFYERLFGFREIRYFDIRGQRTGLRSRALVSPCGKIRIPINEPTERGSQIQEYLAAYHGEGIQHVALASRDVCATVRTLRERGVPFLATPDAYYEDLDRRLPNHGLDVAALRALGVLVDGRAQRVPRSLLQIFTEPVIGPIFFELIERRGDEGFGEGNFRALFEAMERDQMARGVLAPRSAS